VTKGVKELDNGIFLRELGGILTSAIAFRQTTDSKHTYLLFCPGNDNPRFNTSKAQRNAAEGRIFAVNKHVNELCVEAVGTKLKDFTINADKRTRATAYCLECDDGFGTLLDTLERQNVITVPVIECSDINSREVRDTIQEYSNKRERYSLPAFLGDVYDQPPTGFTGKTGKKNGPSFRGE